MGLPKGTHSKVPQTCRLLPQKPPGHPTSRHARNRLPTDEQALLTLKRVKVVGFWEFWVEADGPTAGRRRRARHRNPHSRPYTRLGHGLHHPRAKTSLIGIGEPWKTLRQGPEPSVPANCPGRNLHSRHITTHEQRRAVEESQQKLPLGNGLHHPRAKTSLR